ncbi:MAG: HEAT repeat domain-containing protein [Planctomycetota bacterium]|jgi:tetratricopeptide (TPR) repeat protein
MFHFLFIFSILTGAGSVYGAVTDYPAAAVVCHICSGTSAFYVSVNHRLTGLEPEIFEKALGFLLPCLGGSFLCLYMLLSSFKSRKGIIEDFEQYVSPQERIGEDNLSNIRKGFSPNPNDLSSMADVLRSGASVDDKRAAIESLSRIENPEAIRTLREVLSSDSVEVRFYAASCLSALEERLTARMKLLEEDAASGRTRDPELFTELARTLLDYAYYGLVDGVRKETCLKRAYKYIQQAISHGGLPEVYIIAGRILFMLGELEKAEVMFSLYVKDYPEDDRGLLWRAETSFNLGNYVNMSADCKSALADGKLPERMKESVSVWVADSSNIQSAETKEEQQ